MQRDGSPFFVQKRLHLMIHPDLSGLTPPDGIFDDGTWREWNGHCVGSRMSIEAGLENLTMDLIEARSDGNEQVLASGLTPVKWLRPRRYTVAATLETVTTLPCTLPVRMTG